MISINTPLKLMVLTLSLVLSGCVIKDHHSHDHPRPEHHNGPHHPPHAHGFEDTIMTIIMAIIDFLK